MPTEAPTWEDTLPEPTWDDTEPFQAEPVEIDTSVRNLPDLTASTRGGPRVSLTDANVARATFGEAVGEGMGEVVTHPGIDLPSFAPSLETVQKAMDVTRAASDYETSGTIPNVPTEPSKPTTAAKVITGGIEGVDELARGVVNFFTSGPGVLQLAAARTPLAPAVYAKWTIDMLNAGFTSAQDAWEAFQKSDYRKGAKDTAVAFGSFLGAGAAAKHGYKELTPIIEAVPRGDLRGVKVEEAQQKALEATMPPQDRVAPLAQRIEPEVAEAGLREVLPEAPANADIRGLAEPTIPLTRTRELEQSQGVKGQQIISRLRQEGLTQKQAEDLLSGKLKVQGAVEAVLKDFEAELGSSPNEYIPRGGHDAAMAQAKDQATQRLDDILNARNPDTGKPETYEATERAGIPTLDRGLPEPRRNPAQSIIPEGFVDFDILENPKLGLREPPSGVETIPSGPLPEGTIYKPVGKGYNQNPPANYAFTPDGRVYSDSGRSMTHGGASKWQLEYVTKWFEESKPPQSPSPPTAEVVTQPKMEAVAEQAAASNLPVEFEGTVHSKFSNALVSKDPASGKWRLTWFNEFSGTGEMTPAGHKEYSSRAKALEAAKKLEYKPKQPTPKIEGRSAGVQEQAKAIAQPLPPLEMGMNYPYLNTIVQAIKLSPDGKKVQVRDLKSSTGKKEWVPVTKLNTARFLARADTIEAGVTSKPQPKIEGMGGAIPEEFRPSQSLPTANKNASIDADRVARGEAPLMSAMRKTDPELWDQAMRVVENDWQAADKLIARHRAEPFVPTDTELIVLLHRRTDLKNDFAKLSREYARAIEEGRPEMAEGAKGTRDAILEQLRELEAIVGKGDTAMGTMAGRALRARRLAMNEDYSMASLIVDREAALKRKLTPEELTELEKISQDQAKASEALAKKEAELEARAQEIEAREIATRAAADATAEAPSPYVVKLVESIVKDWDARADRARARLRERMARTSIPGDPTILIDLAEVGLSHLGHAGLNFAKWSARMLADVGEWAKPHLEEVFKRSQKLAEIDVEKRAGPKKEAVQKAIGRATPVEAIDGIVTRVGKRFAKNPNLDFSMAARKIARYYVEQGITKPLELVDAVHAKLVEVMPELTKRETMDALSGYGRFMPLKKDAVSVALRDATGQMQQIAKLEDMAAGIAPKKSGPERRVPTDEERRLIKQVEEKKKEGGYDVTDPETQLRTAMQAAERRLNNQIADLVHQIETREKIVKNKRKLELDDNLKALRDKRDFLKEVYDEVFAPPALTEAQRLAKWKERTQNKIAEYRERLSERDFKPKKRQEIPRLDPEAIKLRYELHKVHNALMDMRLRDQLKQRNAAQKIVGAIANVYRFSRAVMTGGEFSAVLRQGGFAALSRPSLAAKNLKPMFEALMSEQAQFRIMEEIQTRPNAPLYERNKLQFTESGVRLSTMEEHYMFRVSERLGKNPLAKYPIKFVNAFQRAYTTYLNKLRADAFDVLLDTYGDSPQMQKQIANLINVTTGRGSTAVGKFVGPGANTIFFAPRYSISRFQMLLGQPAWGGNAATRKMVIKEYGRALAGAAVVYTLGTMAGGEIESDPRSPDFGKIKLDDTRIDPLFGLSQVTRLLATQATGERLNSKGKEIPIRGKVPYGQPNAFDVGASFVRSKLSPAVGSAVSLAVGKDPVGQKFTLKDALIQSAVPITYGDILKAMEEQGVEKGTAIAVLALFGMGVQTYDANAKRKE